MVFLLQIQCFDAVTELKTYLQCLINAKLAELNRRLNKTLDDERDAARKKRHDKGYRTARENLEDLVDSDSFNEYGQLAVAAQRSRRDYEELQTETAADGIITGLCNINK